VFVTIIQENVKECHFIVFIKNQFHC